MTILVPNTVLCILFVIWLWPVTSHAEDDSAMKSAIEVYERSRLCPVGNKTNILKYEDYCKQYCDRQYTCNRNASNDPCNGTQPEACEKFSRDSRACLDEMNEKNKTILAFNKIVQECKRPRKSEQPLIPPPPGGYVEDQPLIPPPPNGYVDDEDKSTEDDKPIVAIPKHPLILDSIEGDEAGDAPSKPLIPRPETPKKAKSASKACAHPWYQSCMRGGEVCCPPGAPCGTTPAAFENCCRSHLWTEFHLSCR
jgi:hypothetical protein